MQQLAALWSALQGQSGTFDLQSVLIALAIAALRAGIASSNPEAEKVLERLLAAAREIPQPAEPAPDVVPFDPNALRPGGIPLRSLLLFALLCLPISGHCASPKAVILPVPDNC